MTRLRRVFGEVLALGFVNGILLGTALAASNPVPALLVASGGGTFLNMIYLLATFLR